MKLHDNDVVDVILKVLSAAGLLFIAHRIARIYKGTDGKFSQVEFGRFSGFLFFMWAGWYVITKEGTRPSGTEHVFSEMWVFLIFSSMITVLSLDEVLNKLRDILELIVRFRSKLPPSPPTVATTTTTTTSELKSQSTTPEP